MCSKYWHIHKIFRFPYVASGKKITQNTRGWRKDSARLAQVHYHEGFSLNMPFVFLSAAGGSPQIQKKRHEELASLDTCLVFSRRCEKNLRRVLQNMSILQAWHKQKDAHPHEGQQSMTVQQRQKQQQE